MTCSNFQYARRYGKWCCNSNGVIHVGLSPTVPDVINVSRLSGENPGGNPRPGSNKPRCTALISVQVQPEIFDQPSFSGA